MKKNTFHNIYNNGRNLQISVSLSNLVYCLWAKPGAYPRVAKKLEKASVLKVCQFFYFLVRFEPARVEHLSGAPLKSIVLALTSNIRQGPML